MIPYSQQHPTALADLLMPHLAAAGGLHLQPSTVAELADFRITCPLLPSALHYGRTKRGAGSAASDLGLLALAAPFHFVTVLAPSSFQRPKCLGLESVNCSASLPQHAYQPGQSMKGFRVLKAVPLSFGKNFKSPLGDI